MDPASRAGAFVAGGALIGVWLFFVLFKVPGIHLDAGPWLFWGAIGLVMAGAGLGARFATPVVRMGLFVALGIAAGLLASAAVFLQVSESFAALLTACGGAIIASAIPLQAWPDATPADAEREAQA
ncbi:MAG: hypothetical protein QOD77_689 [Thermoplasmata archaeon]|jgi:hypothetical protein|nr:hypothetical protein [Thermoplasmata archaeon]